jgi:hypothetical protein
MAYRFTSASSQYLSAGASITSAFPMSAAFWVLPTNTNNGDFMFFSVGDSNTTHRNQAQRFNNGIAMTAIGTGNAGFNVLNLFTSGQWAHCAFVFESATSRSAYVNGTNVGTNTGNVGSQNAFNETLIGARRNVTIGIFLNDTLADLGLYNVSLTTAEIASLAKGMTCDKVRPQSLVFYAPLVRDLQDVRGGLTITNNNGATVANHPRVYA